MALRWVAAGYFSCMKESGPISVVFAEEVLAKRAEVLECPILCTSWIVSLAQRAG
jgi:hypothetical protein